MNNSYNRAKVSIIVPVYNSEQFLPHCIQSIQEQTYQDWVAIFVNDGSTDGSLRLLQSWAETDSRFHVISKQNGGAASARNVGLDAADTEYITFVDSDDCIAPTFLEKTLNAAINYQCDLVVTSLAFQGKDCGLMISGLMNFSPKIYFKAVHRGPCAKLYRKEIIERYFLRFPEDMSVAEDFVFSSSYAIKIRNIFGIPEALYIYNYVNEQSLVHRFARRDMPLEMYIFNFEAPWRTFSRLIADNDRDEKMMASCVYELYREFWRMYYASCLRVSAENQKKLSVYFRHRHQDFAKYISFFKRICLPQRYPRLYRIALKIRGGIRRLIRR